MLSVLLSLLASAVFDSLSAGMLVGTKVLTEIEPAFANGFEAAAAFFPASTLGALAAAAAAAAAAFF